MTAFPSGPGVACSALRVRRLVAAELAGDERARTEAHLAACARCQETARALEDERRALAAALPFESFAAGVAERLAAPAARPGRRWTRPVALAAAAAVALGLALPLLGRLARLPGAEDGWRHKGAAELALYAKDARGVRVIAPGEPVPRGAALQVGLPPASAHGFAAVALVDRDGASVVYAGPAAAGPVGGAFEWTGEGDGELVLVLSDAPVDARALEERLARGGAAPAEGGGARVIVVPLRRGGP